MQKILLWILLLISPILYETSLTHALLFAEIVLIVSYYIKVRRNSHGKLLKEVSLLFYLLLFWSVFILITHEIDFNSLVRIVQLITCYCCFYIFSIEKWNQATLRVIRNVVCLIIFVLLLVWIAIFKSLDGFTVVYSNPDTFASLLLSWFLFLFLFKPRKFFFILICFFLLLTTGARAAFFSILFFLGSYYLSCKIRFVRNHYKFIFVFFVVLLFSFIIIYPYLLLFDFGDQLNTLSHAYFNKNLLSGRHTVWLEMFDKIKAAPWLGWGLSADPSIVGIMKSSHNLFVQTTLQSGFIGLFLLIILLYKVYAVNIKIGSVGYRSFLICSFLAILFHECFEINLTQNALAIGLVMWATLGLSCNNYFINNQESK